MAALPPLGLMPNLQPVTQTVEHFRSLQQLSGNLQFESFPMYR